MAETETVEPLSDFWRQRQSDQQDEELANVLDGARGYVGFFGSDFAVDWGAINTLVSEKKRIELDFRPLKDKTPPYDGKDIDLVMGTAIHECGHIKWSYPYEDIRNYYARKQGYSARRSTSRFSSQVYLSPEESKEADELKTVANVVEDFFVENKISETYPTLGAYLREARKLDVKFELPHNLHYDLTTDEPSFDSITTMWAAIALIDKEIPKDASKTSKKLLNKLINLTLEAGKATNQKRLKLSYQIWQELKLLARARQKEQERKVKQAHQQMEQRQEKQPSDEKGEPEQEPEGKGEGEGEKPDEQKEETEEGASGKDDGDKEESEEGDQEAEGGKEESPEETEEDKGKPDTEEPKDEHGEEPETEEEAPEGDDEDIEPESRQGSEGEPEEETTENLDEPYLDHEELKGCYSINLDLKESMPQDLKDAVDFFLERKPENITMQVDQMLGGASGSKIMMELAGSDPKLANKIFKETIQIAQKVSRLFMTDKKLRTRFRRGLYEGTVDVRRLHRAGAQDYKLFERKEVLSAPSLAVGIIVDASGSMRGGSYYGGYGYGKERYEGNLDKAIKMAMALKTALSMIEGVDLMVMAYEGAGGGTILYRIYDRKTKEFRPGVKPGGGTPSGHAIAGMVSQIGRYLKGQDKMIIHLTDGAPSSHEDVREAVDYCLKNKIEVMTLTLSRFGNEVVDSYRGLCEDLKNIDDMPDAIAKLLKTRLEKRMMRIR